MKDQAASRTAVLVCQGRAAADGRLAVGVFSDPVAARLLRPDELVPVEQVRRGEQPPGTRERMRYEWVRAVAAVVVPRTVAVDQAVTAAGAPQLVVVGAGLDSRAWRLPVLASSTVYLVDHPARSPTRRSAAPAWSRSPPGSSGSRPTSPGSTSRRRWRRRGTTRRCRPPGCGKGWCRT